MFLATTAIEEFWDRSEDILLAGPWCTRFLRTRSGPSANPPRTRLLANPWDDRERLDQAAHYCGRIVGATLDRLAPILNDIHGVKRSRRYWSILLEPWLARFVHATYDRYAHVQEAIASHADLRSWSLSPEDHVTPRDTRNFIELYLGDFYNLQLYSHAMESSAAGAISTVRRRLDPAPFLSRAGRTGFREFVWRCFSRGAGRWARRPDAELLVCDLFEPRQRWRLARAFSGNSAYVLDDLPPECSTRTRDPSLRQPLDAFAPGALEEGSYESVLAACLGPNLPIVYLEGYSKAREHVLEGRRRMPRVLVSSYGWTTNEALKFLAAEAAECGSRILGHQHGGGYGLWKTHVEDGDADRSDAWFVWGWAGAASNPRTANLPTPKTSELRARDSASTARAHRIVLVGTEHPVYPYYLASIPLGSQYESYIGDRAEFVRGLNSTVRKHLLVRLYPTDYGWGQAGRLREAVGSVELDNHRVRMSRHLRTARVVVVDHPITTLVEALACNCPTILFWNPKLWEARESAVPYLDRLRREGILFDTPSLAAAKLNRVWDDASRWWWSAPVQSARRMFVDQFGGRHANWVEVWRRRLREELDAEE